MIGRIWNGRIAFFCLLPAANCLLNYGLRIARFELTLRNQNPRSSNTMKRMLRRLKYREMN